MYVYKSTYIFKYTYVIESNFNLVLEIDLQFFYWAILFSFVYC